MAIPEDNTASHGAEEITKDQIDAVDATNVEAPDKGEEVPQ